MEVRNFRLLKPHSNIDQAVPFRAKLIGLDDQATTANSNLKQHSYLKYSDV